MFKSVVKRLFFSPPNKPQIATSEQGSRGESVTYGFILWRRDVKYSFQLSVGSD